jgi:hypothetical protein
MMSADPFVPDPMNGQAWNRYSYVINNPLALTDTNGYCFLGACSWGHAVGTFLNRTIGAVFRAAPILGTLLEIAASAVLCGPAEAACLASVAFATTTFVNGVTSGNWGKALRAGLIAGITAGLASTAFSMANEITNSAMEAAVDDASAGLPANALGYANPDHLPVGTMYGPPGCPTCFMVTDSGVGALQVNVFGSTLRGGAGAGGAYEYVMGTLHAALTAASFLPSLAGATFSALDGALYAAQGDYRSAGFAIAAATIGIVADAGAARLALAGAERAAGLLGSACSFAKDTPVTTPEGLTPIGELKIGDRVLARSEETGTYAFEPITKVFRHQDPVKIHLALEDPATGATEVIETTPEHPFHVPGRGFVPAGFLKLNDPVSRAPSNEPAGASVVRLMSVSTSQVLRVKALTFDNQPFWAYNLEVGKDHTFFVGAERAWVHNMCASAFVRSLRITDKLSDKLWSKLVRDIHKNGFENNVIKYAMRGEEGFIVHGSNRFAAATYLGRVDELEFQLVELPFLGYKSVEDLVTVAFPKYYGPALR